MSAGAQVYLSRLRREVRRGFLALWVLEQLAGRPAYGYELLERFSKVPGDAPKVRASTLYPTLARLRASGLVRSFHGTVSAGPLRKYYELTARGRQMLPEIRAIGAEAARLHRSPATPRPGSRGVEG